MEFGLTLEQRQFDDSLRAFLADHLPMERLRALAEPGTGYDERPVARPGRNWACTGFWCRNDLAAPASASWMPRWPPKRWVMPPRRCRSSAAS